MLSACPPTGTTRLRCPGCELLQRQCVCAFIEPMENRTPVRILQHPEESRHALNTARWVVAGLRQAKVICQAHFSADDWCVPGFTPALLFPGEGNDLHQNDVNEHPNQASPKPHHAVLDRTHHLGLDQTHHASLDQTLQQDAADLAPVSLVVIDGTWRQAAGILREHPALLELRRMSLPATRGSAYRLRKSPRADGLSTVEAVVAALDVLDAPRRHSTVLRPFQVQIDRQIALQRRRMGEQAFARNYPHLAE